MRVVIAGEIADEVDWLEWKVGFDLGSAKHRFEMTRHLLGFGNRDPIEAGRHAGGRAFLILGAEPGRLAGQPHQDVTEVVDAIRVYIESGRPPWRPLWLRINEKKVLVIEVEPPAPGDRICTLQKGFNAVQAGAVFVRRHGQTAQADPAEIRMLEDRLMHRRADPLLVQVEAVGAIPTVDLSNEAIDRWLHAWRVWFLAPLALEPPEVPASESESEEAVAPSGSVKRGISLEDVREELARQPARAAEGIGMPERLERRSQTEYKHAVDSWLDECRAVLPAVFMSTIVERQLIEVTFALSNPTDRYQPAVEFTVDFRHAEPIGDLEDDKIELPERPSRWRATSAQRNVSDAWLGRWTVPPVSPLHIPEVHIPDIPEYIADGERVVWDPVGIRQRGKVELEPIPLRVQSGTSSPLTVKWWATSTDFPGVAEGETGIELSGEVLEPTTVLPMPAS